MMENPSVLTNKNSVINKVTQMYEEDIMIIPKVNQGNTSMIKKNHATMAPYLYPNHKSLYLNCLCINVAQNRDYIQTAFQRI